MHGPAGFWTRFPSSCGLEYWPIFVYQSHEIWVGFVVVCPSSCGLEDWPIFVYQSHEIWVGFVVGLANICAPVSWDLGWFCCTTTKPTQISWDWYTNIGQSSSLQLEGQPCSKTRRSVHTDRVRTYGTYWSALNWNRSIHSRPNTYNSHAHVRTVKPANSWKDATSYPRKTEIWN